jgi:hypothetical protein
MIMTVFPPGHFKESNMAPLPVLVFDVNETLLDLETIEMFNSPADSMLLPVALGSSAYPNGSYIKLNKISGPVKRCDVAFWQHLTDVHADAYFGRFRGENGHAASTRVRTRDTPGY